MTQLLQAAPPIDCWNRIGVHGDRSCPELVAAVHCHNCPVFVAAGQTLLDHSAPPDYLAEARERLTQPLEDVSTDLFSGLVFRLGDEWLIVNVLNLIEVTTPRPVHRVPGRSGLLAGMVNIRGELQLCVHLKKLLTGSGDIAPVAPSENAGSSTTGQELANSARMLVIERERERWVVPVDEVDQVYRFSLDDLRLSPATIARSAGRLTRGVYHDRGRAIGHLDDARLFHALRTRLLQ